MTRFRSRPVEIDAHQWDGTAEGASPIIDWILREGGTATYTCADPARCSEHDGDSPHTIAITTLEGTMHASLHDWIIRGTEGEFYPCKPSVFARKYEPAEDQDDGDMPAYMTVTDTGWHCQRCDMTRTTAPDNPSEYAVGHVSARHTPEEQTR